jgi:hypothetical protein
VRPARARGSTILSRDHDRRGVAAGVLHGIGAGPVFYFSLMVAAPLGQLDVFYSAPPAVTGFYLLDAVIAGFRNLPFRLQPVGPACDGDLRWRRSRA